MATPQVQADPIYSLPFLYSQGLSISNDSTTPNTVLDIGAGQCRDSNDNIDMGIGTLSPPLNGNAVTAPVLLNGAVNGFNGLDTGSLAANTMYAVYVIGDSQYRNPVGAIATLASNTSPLMPFGYDSSRLIGYWPTNGSSQWYKGYYVSGVNKSFYYDAPPATSVIAGAATAYTAINLVTLVPPINNVLVKVQSNFTANAAGDTLKMQPLNGTGDMVTIIAPVVGSTAHVQTVSDVLAQLSSGAPEINYKVSSSSDSVAINVAGFSFSA